MRLSGRLSAAIEILEDFDKRRVPLKTAIADWARCARYAGAKDRAWISGLCLDVLRKRMRIAVAMRNAAMLNDEPRALAIGALRFVWNMSIEEIAEAAGEMPHGPGELTEVETQALKSKPLVPMFELPSSVKIDGQNLDVYFVIFCNHIAGDFPEWLTPQIERVFGDDAARTMSSFAERADIDLRINTLKTEPEKALAALKKVKGEALPLLTTSARIAAPDSAERAPAVTVIPAFNKGWVEVQDVSSQIAAAAAGAVKGVQVLDFCAGGGGKTLALAALMENTGQLYAYDSDARRLKPLYHRVKRAGVRNLQVINPATDQDALENLKEKMDVVFIDAPCTGVGTWRRHPDTKWRLTPQQLERRIAEQDAVLREAAVYVKPGGRLVWATCSCLMEENEDRLETFLDAHPDFAMTPALDEIAASGLLTDEGRIALAPCVTPEGALRITPDRLRGDGFFIATLKRTG